MGRPKIEDTRLGVTNDYTMGKWNGFHGKNRKLGQGRACLLESPSDRFVQHSSSHISPLTHMGLMRSINERKDIKGRMESRKDGKMKNNETRVKGER